MRNFTISEWNEFQAAFALIGNLLLTPMNQTSGEGLDANIWREAPCFGDESIANLTDSLACWCEQTDASDYESLSQMVAVEYTQLFVGPPRFSVAPWESMHVVENAQCGFGEATFQMKELLRQADLQLSGAHHQYEDHMGVELLLLSELCGRVASQQGTADEVFTFAKTHPAAWIDSFCNGIKAAAPSGYYYQVAQYAQALVRELCE